MRLHLLSCALLLGMFPACVLAAEPHSTVQSRTLLHQALDAQGGEQLLRSIKSVQWEASGYRNELEESERPEGPYITEFDRISETHDWAGHRYRSVSEAEVYPVFKFLSGTVVDHEVAMQVSDGGKSPGTPQQLQLVREREALSPERLVLTALDAPDVHAEPDTVLQSRRRTYSHLLWMTRPSVSI